MQKSFYRYSQSICHYQSHSDNFRTSVSKACSAFLIGELMVPLSLSPVAFRVASFFISFCIYGYFFLHVLLHSLMLCSPYPVLFMVALFFMSYCDRGCFILHVLLHLSLFCSLSKLFLCKNHICFVLYVLLHLWLLYSLCPVAFMVALFSVSCCVLGFFVLHALLRSWLLCYTSLVAFMIALFSLISCVYGCIVLPVLLCSCFFVLHVLLCS